MLIKDRSAPRDRDRASESERARKRKDKDGESGELAQEVSLECRRLLSPIVLRIDAERSGGVYIMGNWRYPRAYRYICIQQACEREYVYSCASIRGG